MVSSPRMPTFVERIAALQDYKQYEDLHWHGTFEEYLELVRGNPRVARTAHERLYDMIISHGSEEYVDNKKKIIHYRFFDDEAHNGRDAIFGLDIPLMRLVAVLKAAAMRYGTEKRILLLHGPVGSAKSTIVRLLKLGMEEYSRTPEGALYTYEWVLAGGPAVPDRRPGAVPLADARGAAQAHPARVARAVDGGPGARKGRVPPPRQGRAQPRLPLHLRRADGALSRRLGEGHPARPGQAPVDQRAGPASASAPSNPRTRRTRTPPSSPARSTTGASRSSARTRTRARSTSTVSSTSPTAASSSSSRS